MKVILLLIAAACAVQLESVQAQNKVICYYTNWSVYREGGAKYWPADLDTSVCTHILYSFATLNNQTLQIQVYDPDMDIEAGFYQQVTALKSQGVKVMIALGGWTDSETDKYSRMVSDPVSRANFVSTAVSFIQQHNFDGLDLDWEYPKCWVGNCDAGPVSDKENFVNLVRELKTAFAPHGYLLSSAVSASRHIGDQAYDIPALSESLDWIGLMTYDYHGGWDGVTGHNSPLKGAVPNSEDTVNYWVSRGAAPEKLILGVGFYGRSWTLENENDNGVGAPAATGAPGQYTGEPGFLAYFELCSGWTYRNVENVGPYGYKGDQWASFDDEAILGLKADFVKERGLAGAMIWAIDLDDFTGAFCGKGKYPLAKALTAALN